MPGNTFGELFRVTTGGVSHGPGYAVILDGFPPPTFERGEDGRHAIFNYDGQVFDLKSTARDVEVIRLYPRGLRRATAKPPTY